jgi:hypothetical protein
MEHREDGGWGLLPSPGWIPAFAGMTGVAVAGAVARSREAEPPVAHADVAGAGDHDVVE